MQLRRGKGQGVESLRAVFEVVLPPLDLIKKEHDFNNGWNPPPLPSLTHE